MDADAEIIVRSVVDAANSEDMKAARIILDRISPIRKGRPLVLDLLTAKSANNVAAALSAVVKATAIGDVTPDEAAIVAGVPEAHRRSIETVNLEAQLAALEEKAAAADEH